MFVANTTSWLRRVAGLVAKKTLPEGKSAPCADLSELPVGCSDQIAGISELPVGLSEQPAVSAILTVSDPVRPGFFPDEAPNLSGPFTIDRVDLLDGKGTPPECFVALSPFQIRISYHCEGEPQGDTIAVALRISKRLDSVAIIECFTDNFRSGESQTNCSKDPKQIRAASEGTIVLDFPYVPLRKGDYLLSVGLLANRDGNWKFNDYRHPCCDFSVVDGGLDGGAPVLLQPRVRHNDSTAPLGKTDCQLDKISRSAAEIPTTLREEIHDICFAEGGYPEKWPRHEFCPVCNSTSVYSSFSKYGFVHDQCAACRFVFVNPFPSQEVSRRLYSGYYYSRMREHYELPRLRDGERSAFTFDEEILEEVIRTCTQGAASGRWLDVGGGLGACVLSVQDLRPGWEVCMTEWNPLSRDIATKEFGIRVVDEDPGALARTGEAFDVISMVAVLEHCANPLEFVRQYMGLLREGGMLVIMVPHFTHLVTAVAQGASANVVPPFHLSLFTEANLRLLMQRVGEFTSIETRQFGGPAFLLYDHVSHGDHWDVTIPSADDPAPRSIRIHSYTELENATLNVLGEVHSKVAEFFAVTDGRTNLLAIAQRK